MIESNLKYPGPLSHSQRLRRLTSICISAAEQAESVSPGSSTATTLKQFLEDAADKCPGESGVVPTPQPPTEATVKNGDTFTDGDYTVAMAVASNVATAKVSIPGTQAIVKNAQTFTDGSFTVSMAVASNTATASVTLPATSTTVANNTEFTDATGTYKFTVAGGEITAVTFTPAP